MNFEKAYEKYIAGEASDEEKAFVEDEIAKAQKLTEIIDNFGVNKDVLATSEMQDVRRAQRKHSAKLILRMTLIALTCLIVIAGAVCGGIFGQAHASANKNAKYTIEQAKEIALDFVKTNYGEPDVSAIVTEVDKELKLSTKLKHSIYVYYVEIQNGSKMEIELMFNTQTGIVTLIDID